MSIYVHCLFSYPPAKLSLFNLIQVFFGVTIKTFTIVTFLRSDRSELMQLLDFNIYED